MNRQILNRRAVVAYGCMHSIIMSGVIVYASRKEFILDAGYLFDFPWYWATLWDTYLSFFVLALWVLFTEKSFLSKSLWTISFLCLGNMAIGLYIAVRAWRLPGQFTLREFLSGGTS